MALEGKGNETIAHILQQDQILIPAEYWRGIGVHRPNYRRQPDPFKWGKTTVAKILTQQGVSVEYLRSPVTA